MKVLGIDPGTRVTGYGVVEGRGGSKLTRVADGEIKVSDAAALSERLHAISAALRAVIAEHSPDAVAIEAIFHAKNVRSTIAISHMRGAALLVAAEAGLQVHEYSPASVKQAVVGYGAAEKKQVEHMVKLLLKADSVAGSDSADALAVAICHLNHDATLAKVVCR